MYNESSVKDRLKNLAKKFNLRNDELFYIFFIERFLERLAKSSHKKKFVIKGGLIISSITGIDRRTMKDLDASVIGKKLGLKELEVMLLEILKISLNDSVKIELEEIKKTKFHNIFLGYEVKLKFTLGKITNKIVFDIVINDVLLERAIDFEYKSIIENKAITINSYTVEMILAEKLQTLLYHGIFNTRMKDFYDLHILWKLKEEEIDLKKLFLTLKDVCIKRQKANLLDSWQIILEEIETNDDIHSKWNLYKDLYSFTKNLEFKQIIEEIKTLLQKTTCKQ
ncbi:nucleotidyl transferase AbiEii/AbiGii toxin family protein [Mycoplasma sp. 3341]|uniref:nucleotidyl transferase AbiEii/AbiGii toxin family protein n=1 Tax=Mycoplasma sp. 3341 TaxID=3447506 RepID=UPI003F65F88E